MLLHCKTEESIFTFFFIAEPDIPLGRHAAQLICELLWEEIPLFAIPLSAAAAQAHSHFHQGVKHKYQSNYKRLP